MLNRQNNKIVNQGIMNRVNNLIKAKVFFNSLKSWPLILLFVIFSLTNYGQEWTNFDASAISSDCNGSGSSSNTGNNIFFGPTSIQLNGAASAGINPNVSGLGYLFDTGSYTVSVDLGETTTRPGFFTIWDIGSSTTTISIKLYDADGVLIDWVTDGTYLGQWSGVTTPQWNDVLNVNTSNPTCPILTSTGPGGNSAGMIYRFANGVSRMELTGNVTISSDGVGVGFSQDNCVDPCSGKEVFTYLGADQHFTVPDGVTEITVKAWGAGGAGSGKVGGAGGFTSGTFGVVPGDVLTIVVGEGGDWLKDPNSPAPYGGGGRGGINIDNSNSSAAPGVRNGDGGGLSGIFRSSSFSSAVMADAMIIAGGGGSGSNHSTSGVGGAGGGLSGIDGENTGDGGVPGLGGSQVAGGVAGSSPGGVGTNGTLFTGGDGAPGPYQEAGHGGGGGYFGGGGGSPDYAANHAATGAGGGGSSFIGTGSSTTTLAGTSDIPAMQGDIDYVSGVAVGGQLVNTNTKGGNGLVVIGWEPDPCGPCGATQAFFSEVIYDFNDGNFPSELELNCPTPQGGVELAGVPYMNDNANLSYNPGTCSSRCIYRSYKT